MTSERDASGFVVLDRRACLERLALQRVATLAITDGALPLVLPVLYVLHDDDVLVGASTTGVLGRRMPNSIVSMCVHDLTDDLLSGWTVTITGRAELLPAPVTVADAAALPRWGGEEASQVVIRVATERMSGRQIPLRTTPLL